MLKKGNSIVQNNNRWPSLFFRLYLPTLLSRTCDDLDLVGKSFAQIMLGRDWLAWEKYDCNQQVVLTQCQRHSAML